MNFQVIMSRPEMSFNFGGGHTQRMAGPRICEAVADLDLDMLGLDYSRGHTPLARISDQINAVGPVMLLQSLPNSVLGWPALSVFTGHIRELQYDARERGHRIHVTGELELHAQHESIWAALAKPFREPGYTILKQPEDFFALPPYHGLSVSNAGKPLLVASNKGDCYQILRKRDLRFIGSMVDKEAADVYSLAYKDTHGRAAYGLIADTTVFIADIEEVYRTEPGPSRVYDHYSVRPLTGLPERAEKPKIILPKFKRRLLLDD